MRRGHTVRDVEVAVDRCREHGLVPVVDFTVGLPIESEEDEKKTVHLIQEITRNGRVRVHHFSRSRALRWRGLYRIPCCPAQQDRWEGWRSREL